MKGFIWFEERKKNGRMGGSKDQMWICFLQFMRRRKVGQKLGKGLTSMPSLVVTLCPVAPLAATACQSH